MGNVERKLVSRSTLRVMKIDLAVEKKREKEARPLPGRGGVLRRDEVRGLADSLGVRACTCTRGCTRVGGEEGDSCRRSAEFIWEWRPVSVGKLQRVRP